MYLWIRSYNISSEYNPIIYLMNVTLYLLYSINMPYSISNEFNPKVYIMNITI